MALVFKKEKTVNKVVLLPINEILTNPSQPRTNFAEEQLDVLATSIRENGLLQPLTVRRNGEGKYELISGERRLRACKKLGEQQVPCIIVEKTERESAVLALIENIHREDLDVFEQAEALKKLIAQWGVTQEEAAVKLGMAQSTVANKLRLLKLTPEEQTMILENGLTERHARALLKLTDEQQRKEAMAWIIKKNFNVAQTDEYVTALCQVKHRKKYIPIVKDVRLFLNTVNKAIQVMKEAGIPATSEKHETEEGIEYIVRIPTKTGGIKSHG
ncbi:MAG: ParB/RepB/Spo0J family partition protein [Massiliimalia sp.]|jgi:ParB family chromosome partitioning protein